MSDEALDALVANAVNGAMVATGMPVAWVAANGGRGSGEAAGGAARPPRWTAAEDEFYLANIGRMSYEEIAARLGRTLNGLIVHVTRRGLPRMLRVDGWLTACQASKILGVDLRKVPNWIDAGVMPGELVATTSGRALRRLTWIAFKRWLVRPESWIYFDVRKMRPGSLRRLVELAQAKWNDRWLTTIEVDRKRGIDRGDTLRQIKLGKLRGVQVRCLSGRKEHQNQVWAYWYVRESEAMVIPIAKGKGAGGVQRVVYSPRAEAFLRKCWEDGLRVADIARLMRKPHKQVAYYAREIMGLRRSNGWYKCRHK